MPPYWGKSTAASLNRLRPAGSLLAVIQSTPNTNQFPGRFVRNGTIQMERTSAVIRLPFSGAQRVEDAIAKLTQLEMRSACCCGEISRTVPTKDMSLCQLQTNIATMPRNACGWRALPSISTRRMR